MIGLVVERGAGGDRVPLVGEHPGVGAGDDAGGVRGVHQGAPHPQVRQRRMGGVEVQGVGDAGVHEVLRLDPVVGLRGGHRLGRQVEDRMDLPGGQRAVAGGVVLEEAPGEALRVGGALVLRVGRGGGVVVVAHHHHLLVAPPLDDLEGAGAHRQLAVLGQAPPHRPRGLDPEERLGEHGQQRRVGALQRHAHHVLGEGLGGDEVRGEVEQRRGGLGGGVHDLVEVRDHRVGVERLPVVEAHALLEGEVVDQAVLGDLPRLGEPGHDAAVGPHRDQGVEVLAGDVGLGHVAAVVGVQAGGLAVCGEDELAALPGAGGQVRGAAGAAAGGQHGAGSHGGQAGHDGSSAHGCSFGTVPPAGTTADGDVRGDALGRPATTGPEEH